MEAVVVEDVLAWECDGDCDPEWWSWRGGMSVFCCFGRGCVGMKEGREEGGSKGTELSGVSAGARCGSE